jgi:hypothetical protein
MDVPTVLHMNNAHVYDGKIPHPHDLRDRQSQTGFV